MDDSIYGGDSKGIYLYDVLVSPDQCIHRQTVEGARK
jgi:hypothetical protein